ncbi:LacI family DNA-binding transcriptional regulator [Pseudokineococcus lusitanus]|uniref:LacI family transcriptional regulator n=1 Tax=Pseudokineococcus lusitanus TaxID=763993 RepID=A0A3N1GA25_9ACTN|nr:LacI family DNA-binding transcriptional regulator [Pseudokineococcus lusitanus]ROP27083.1 LacI family transcriptional regulator [Pseudokineococcus lusitanus]
MSTPVPARAPVMTDVARRAGVSHQTVSRVLNGHHSVRPETRERVEAAIAELGYRRNRAARALVTRQTLTLGVVASSAPLHGPSSMLAAVERAAHGAGYATMIASADGTGREEVLERLAQVSDRGVDGVVVTAPLHELPDLAEHLPVGLPVVCASGAPVDGVPTVHVDHRGGARALVRHLLDLGHTEVRHVGGAAGWWESEGRAAGYEDEMEAAGLEPAPVLAGGWSPAEGYRAGLELLADRTATAVVAPNDHSALGLLLALREHDVDVPGRLSVTGFDDVPEAAYLQPPLTTVRQHFARVGEVAVEMLLARLADAASPVEHRVVAPDVVVRRSTAAAPTA